MTRKAILLSMVMMVSLSWMTPEIEWIQVKHNEYVLFYTEADDKDKADYVRLLDRGIESVESFFGDSFRSEFKVYIHPNRQSLDIQWQRDWNMPEFKSECWMVASGTATKFDMISPKRWEAEACEHSYSDLAKTQQLVAHELVHVYHGQHNASPDFSDVTNVDWFVEGLATYASGQCDASRMNAVKQALESNTVPSSLDHFWTGKLKYGLSGSVVMYIDHTFGRSKLKELLRYNRKDELLKSLGIEEDRLLRGWKEFMKADPASH